MNDTNIQNQDMMNLQAQVSQLEQQLLHDQHSFDSLISEIRHLAEKGVYHDIEPRRRLLLKVDDTIRQHRLDLTILENKLRKLISRKRLQIEGIQ